MAGKALKPRDSYNTNEDEYAELHLPQAFYLFVETKLKPYHERMKIGW